MLIGSSVTVTGCRTITGSVTLTGSLAFTGPPTLQGPLTHSPQLRAQAASNSGEEPGHPWACGNQVLPAQSCIASTEQGLSSRCRRRGGSPLGEPHLAALRGLCLESRLPGLQSLLPRCLCPPGGAAAQPWGEPAAATAPGRPSQRFQQYCWKMIHKPTQPKRVHTDKTAHGTPKSRGAETRRALSQTQGWVCSQKTRRERTWDAQSRRELGS